MSALSSHADYDGSHDFNNLRSLALLRTNVSKRGLPVPVVATLVGMASTTGMGYRFGTERDTQPNGDGASPAEVAACIDQHTPDVIDYSIVDSAVVPPEAAAAMHSEALWVVSGCYMPEDPAQPMGECSRSSWVSAAGAHG